MTILYISILKANYRSAWSPYNYAMNNLILFIDRDGIGVSEINRGVRHIGADAQAYSLQKFEELFNGSGER